MAAPIRSTLVLAALAGCATGPRNPVQAPSYVAVMEGLDPAESSAVREHLAAFGGEGSDKSKTITLPSTLVDPSALREVCKEIEAWHQRVVEIKDETGLPIALNAGIEVRLKYTSARADTVSVAVVRIRPEPAGAKLFIDTLVPGLEELKAEDGSVVLNHPEKKPTAFRMKVPFSFIRAHREIFFRTEHKGVQSHFVFDLDTQTQRKVDGNFVLKQREVVSR